MPFINKSEATKWSRYRKENGKCTNATNRRSHVSVSTAFYTDKMYTTNVTVFRAHERVTAVAAVTCLYPLSPSRALSNCARKIEEPHWIAVRVSFQRFRVSGMVFTRTKSTRFCQNTTYQTCVVDSEVALWLTRMFELSRFVYIGSHVTLHVKSNA